MCPQIPVSLMLKTIPANPCETKQGLYPQVGETRAIQSLSSVSSLGEEGWGENTVILEASSAVSGPGSKTSSST